MRASAHEHVINKIMYAFWLVYGCVRVRGEQTECTRPTSWSLFDTSTVLPRPHRNVAAKCAVDKYMRTLAQRSNIHSQPHWPVLDRGRFRIAIKFITLMCANAHLHTHMEQLARQTARWTLGSASSIRKSQFAQSGTI